VSFLSRPRGCLRIGLIVGVLARFGTSGVSACSSGEPSGAPSPTAVEVSPEPAVASDSPLKNRPDLDGLSGGIPKA
jgi:hypothetical protein